MNLRYFADMAARSAVAPARWRRPFWHWLDGIERGWGIGALIAAFCGAWFLFFVIAYLSNDLHVDALESWSVGREFSWGGNKHPPLMGWVARVWTMVMPLTDWSFQLLAMVNSALALWAVDLISRRFVSGDKRAVVLLLAMLLPAYQFHAQRFNANTVLLAVWPLAIYCFLRAFESRTLLFSIATGLFCGLAMLGKYYSVFLLVSMTIAALAHPDRARYWRSWSPWLSVATLAIVLGPHIHWLINDRAATFAYAVKTQAGISSAQAAREAMMFLAGIAAALGLPALVWVLTAETRLKYIRADFRKLSPGLRLLFLILAGTVLLPMIVAVAMGTYLPSLWALQGLFLVILIVVAGAHYEVERLYTVNMIVMVFGIAAVAVMIGAPLHAQHRNGAGANERSYYRIVAAEVTRRWAELGEGPLRHVAGDEGLALGTAFYGADRAFYRAKVDLTEGGAFVCFTADQQCMTKMASLPASFGQQTNVRFVAQPQLWGTLGPPAEVAVAMILPSRPEKRPDDEDEFQVSTMVEDPRN